MNGGETNYVMATVSLYVSVVPMNEMVAPDMAIAAKNQRDAKLLTAVGAISLMGSAIAWLN